MEKIEITERVGLFAAKWCRVFFQGGLILSGICFIFGMLGTFNLFLILLPAILGFLIAAFIFIFMLIFFILHAIYKKVRENTHV